MVSGIFSPRGQQQAINLVIVVGNPYKSQNFKSSLSRNSVYLPYILVLYALKQEYNDNILFTVYSGFFKDILKILRFINLVGHFDWLLAP